MEIDNQSQDSNQSDVEQLATPADHSENRNSPSSPSRSGAFSATPSGSGGLLEVDGLPDSVRGAPEELKPAIRKKQNKESARRSRRRRKELVSNLSQTLDVLRQRSADVEARVAHIEGFLSGIGFQKLLVSSSPLPVARASREGASDGGAPGAMSDTPSIPGSLGGGSHSERGSRTGRSGRGGAPGNEDDDVQRLIEKCIGQL